MFVPEVHVTSYNEPLLTTTPIAPSSTSRLGLRERDVIAKHAFRTVLLSMGVLH